LVARLFLNGPSASDEQPDADGCENHGHSQPGAALRAARTAGKRGDGEDDGERGEDVFGEHSVTSLLASAAAAKPGRWY